ncbi:hypothetical protein EGT74_21730 [Chitinophaga lutea]|uniref:WxL domain-containing protein n=1 Tax=Chitinophaga lutea TaxID=2488634 RepID=A0A3N4PWU4_9BACT|nr:hypothetical protein [Chitinophaga lutea]RPE09601.1 hypothetical protein EGT74_21730 [Chitinophaga lutea]
MKQKFNIIQRFSLSCLMVSALFMLALSVQANDLGGNLDNEKDKVVKKTETRYNLTAMPKTNLSLDAGFKASGILKTDFNLSSDNSTVNVKSVLTYKRGNVTYIVPYSVQAQPVPSMKYHQVQFNLPFRKN